MLFSERPKTVKFSIIGTLSATLVIFEAGLINI